MPPAMVAWGLILSNLPRFADLVIRTGDMIARYRGNASESPSDEEWEDRFRTLEDRVQEQAKLFKELVERTEETARALAVRTEQNRRLLWVAGAVAAFALALSAAAFVSTVAA